MDASNLLSGLIGALVGAGASFFGVWFQLKKQYALAERERLAVHVDTAIKILHEIDAKIPSLPYLNMNAFTLKQDEGTELRKQKTKEILSMAKAHTQLLPEAIKEHWEQWYQLVTDLAVSRSWDEVLLNRAMTDVDNFSKYTVGAINDWKSNSEIRVVLKFPYLQRKSTEAWTPSTGEPKDAAK